MQRYFIEPWENLDTVELTGEDAHHLSRVMRAKLKDQVILCDGQGKEALGEVVEIHPKCVELKLIETHQREKKHNGEIVIGQSLPKSDKMDWIIQKCTEIGVDGIIPFYSSRTVVHYETKKALQREERWRKIAKEASEQAHRVFMPHISAIQTFDSFLNVCSTYDIVCICYEGADEIKWPKFQPDQRILIVIGPEGGFSEQEIQELQARHGQVIRIGEHILRTETAGIVMLTCALYQFGEIGG